MDNLHPLESKVLLALTRQPDAPPTLDQLAESTGLEPSQLSMAVEWLLAKSLIAVHLETVAHNASLTPIGELFFEKYAPIERVLSAAREAGQTGKRLTIQDIQAKEALEPSDVSKAVGTLKQEGAILIVQGGCIESTGRNSATTEAMRSLLQELRSGQRELQSFSEPLRSVLQQHAVKRGNAREPFRIDERVTRSFVLTPAGQEVAEQLSRDGVAEEVSQLTPEMLRPERPLSMSVIAAQGGLIASPISAATVAMVGALVSLQVSLLDIHLVIIPATVVGIVAGIVSVAWRGKKLSEDPVFQERVIGPA